jgi:hypothetical protein
MSRSSVPGPDVTSRIVQLNAGHPSIVERRAAQRVALASLSEQVALLVAGSSEPTVVNISATGVLIETAQRLCPGRAVDILMRLGNHLEKARAHVVRSQLLAITPATMFEVALRFERQTTPADCARIAALLEQFVADSARRAQTRR